MATPETWDLIVVGGGAAGFYGAIRCGEATYGQARILILERSSRVLQKVRISGGGRCNVTHDTSELKWLATNYPRGNKALIGPFHRHGPHDVVHWFRERDVSLKTESDGRMFPTTDDSQTVIDCLRKAADDVGVVLHTRKSAELLRRTEDGFEIICRDDSRYRAKTVLLATGGTRSGPGAALASSVGHSLEPAVPSLFTFEIDDPRIKDLPGVSLENVATHVVDTDLRADGPLVVTHWGLSGPAILKLSAWGARELHDRDYEFSLEVDWLPGVDLESELKVLGQDKTWTRRQVASRTPFEPLPKRLWQSLVEAAGVPSTTNWAECSKAHRAALVEQLSRARFEVTGQSVNKDEFVTCGGVRTDDVDMRTMESRLCDGLFFAGELLDIDGVTGGFNFQSAWTTGYLAAQAIAERF